MVFFFLEELPIDIVLLIFAELSYTQLRSKMLRLSKALRQLANQVIDGIVTHLRAHTLAHHAEVPPSLGQTFIPLRAGPFVASVVIDHVDVVTPFYTFTADRVERTLELTWTWVQPEQGVVWHVTETVQRVPAQHPKIPEQFYNHRCDQLTTLNVSGRRRHEALASWLSRPLPKDSFFYLTGCNVVRKGTFARVVDFHKDESPTSGSHFVSRLYKQLRANANILCLFLRPPSPDRAVNDFLCCQIVSSPG